MERFLLTLSLFILTLTARPILDIFSPRVISQKQVNYAPYEDILKQAVNDQGEVNYLKIKQKLSELRNFIHHLQEVDTEKLSQDEELCYYINFYNAVVLYQVALYYPIRSVMSDFPGGNFFRNEFYFQGKTISLDDLENKIIRKKFKNPYIHFALNCASRSCPVLETKAWTAKGLKKRFLAAALRYLKDIRHNRYDKEKNVLYLSELFRWYQEDFQDLVSFYEKHANVKVLPNVKIEFLPYDWSLNEPKN